MSRSGRPSIRFKHRSFAELRSALLGEETRESFAVLLAKRQVIGTTEIFTVRDVRLPDQEDYQARSVAFLKMRKDFIHQALAEAAQRLDVDTIIDVHTHPFAKSGVAFSGVDDDDEQRFAEWLGERFDNLHYASIVLSQERYQARLWVNDGKKTHSKLALIRTQTALEDIPESATPSSLLDANEERLITSVDAIYNRGALALGLEAMRAIMHQQTVALVGVGGIGSAVAEHLIQMGFQHLVLIDPDRLDPSNLNRFVGANFTQAKEEWLKVDAVSSHLTAINPEVQITTCPHGVESDAARELIAGSNWIIVSSDSHSSRWEAQRLALRCFVPIISAGVNITVNNGVIEDMSGEVITARAGDRWCLNCLGRVNLAIIAAESHPDPVVRELTVQRGYVAGMAVKEPAVKTLNTIIAAMAADRLVDQYLPNRADIPVLVYERNRALAIYEDRDSMEYRHRSCCHCDV
ncbi:MAG: ThiF family adenylyltransferase [Geobacteraceae bacterium]|nr:ThiF family adenylyltransferase [Geobacteraceae bacterium]